MLYTDPAKAVSYQLTALIWLYFTSVEGSTDVTICFQVLRPYKHHAKPLPLSPGSSSTAMNVHLRLDMNKSMYINYTWQQNISLMEKWSP